MVLTEDVSIVLTMCWWRVTGVVMTNGVCIVLMPDDVCMVLMTDDVPIVLTTDDVSMVLTTCL